jgi:hypothetical protein
MDEDYEELQKLKKIKRRKKAEQMLKSRKYIFTDYQWSIITAVFGIGIVRFNFFLKFEL